MTIRACRWQDKSKCDMCCEERIPEKCVDAGAGLIVVSNHGGHTLDYLSHLLSVIDEIGAAVDGQITFMVDGNFRRGSDVLKGLAFGANLVGLGKPVIYPLLRAAKARLPASSPALAASGLV